MVGYGGVPAMADSPARWDISGSYLEACNCHAVCPFALSSQILCAAVMAGWYTDTAKQQTPWSVARYVDNGASDAQAIGEIHHVRRADISLDHTSRRWRVRVDTHVDDAPLSWNLRERRGFATDLHYSS